MRMAFQGGSTAQIDAQSCTECGACELACRFDAVSACVTDSGARCYVVDRWTCEGCSRCSLSCPSGAISLENGRAGSVCFGEWEGGGIAWGALAPGEDLSGKLVTEVRTLAWTSATEAWSDLVLVDGPPGVGCPTIAALADTDLLIAVTEPSASGAHDLERLLELATSLGVPSKVVLNKADLSAEGAEHIRSVCERRDVELVAEVPFDTSLAATLDTMSASGLAAPGLRDVANSPQADALWDAVASRL
jgi:MinD superfamily P-loop ATPase